MQKNPSVSFAAILICTLAALFYLYEFTLQVSPGVMTHELMRDLGLNAASLGLVSGFYYYAYTPMQIPAGLLHDRFGPRMVLTLAIIACSLGAFFFATSQTLTEAALGRVLMGIGSAFFPHRHPRPDRPLVSSDLFCRAGRPSSVDELHRRDWWRTSAGCCHRSLGLAHQHERIGHHRPCTRYRCLYLSETGLDRTVILRRTILSPLISNKTRPP